MSRMKLSRLSADVSGIARRSPGFGQFQSLASVRNFSIAINASAATCGNVMSAILHSTSAWGKCIEKLGFSINDARRFAQTGSFRNRVEWTLSVLGTQTRGFSIRWSQISRSEADVMGQLRKRGGIWQ